MSNPFLGQITMVGFNFAPRGYAQCDGAILSINQNQSLFALLGTTFGGDGRSTFGLPDLRSRTPIHKGSANGDPSHSLGSKTGQETVKLIDSNMPTHDHVLNASPDNATSNTAGTGANRVLAKADIDMHRSPGTLVGSHPDTITTEGGDLSHNNMQPFLTIKFNIALQGVFPSRN